MKYCVTGATGLLGNNLCRHLLEYGHAVVAPVRESSDLEPLKDLPVEVYRGDLTHPEFVQSIMAGVEGVFHCAGLIWLGRNRLRESRIANVDTTRALADVCRAARIRLTHVSTTDALSVGRKDRPANESDLQPPKSDSNYVVTKREAEQLLVERWENDQLDVVITNPGLFFGPFDWRVSSGQMLNAIASGFVPLAPGGGISVADVRQVARGVAAAMESGRSGERYILAGENVTYLELWQRIARIVEKPAPRIRLPGFIAATSGFIGDIMGRIGWETQVNSAAIRMGQSFNFYDSTKAIAELGYDPGDATQAIRDHWEWMQNRD